MKISKREFIDMLDNSFISENRDIITRWSKGVILSAIASEVTNKELGEDYLARLTYIQHIMEKGDEKDFLPGGIICLCQAYNRLGYNGKGRKVLSETRENEREIIKILKEVNIGTLESMINDQID